MTNLLRISIIVAVYNGAKTLPRCIDSIVCQTYSNIELIIVDGASTDSTVDIIKSYGDKVSFWVSEADEGVYDAWNKAIEYCSAGYVYFMGCDDAFRRDNVLKTVADKMDRLDYDLVCGSVLMRSPLKNKEVLLVPNAKSASHVMLPHQGVFHSRSLFTEFGLFDNGYAIRGDFEFFVRCFSGRRLKVLTVSEVIAVCELGGLSNNWQSAWKTFTETVDIYNKYGMSLLQYELAMQGVKALGKSFFNKLGIKPNA